MVGRRRWWTALAALAFFVVPGAASAQVPEARPFVKPVLGIEVPYLAQSEWLCGGAALAMLARWGGRRGVFPEDFAPLVRPSLGGILTTDLVAAALGRGWPVTLVSGSPVTIQQLLQGGVPVMALIAVGKARYHYVVVVDWSGGVVTYHDPTRGPSVQRDEADFVTAWRGADSWAMVVGTTSSTVDSNAAATVPQSDSLPCRPWLDQGVAAATANQLSKAEQLLATAERACPGEALVLREYAAVLFRQGRYAAAIPWAMRSLELAPNDSLTWQLLGTSRYLTGDPLGALQAWHQIGRPTVDHVDIAGAQQSHHAPVATAVGPLVHRILTPRDLAIARRRLRELPALQGATIEYLPLAGGLAEVQVEVSARATLAPWWRIAAANAVRSVAQHELALDVASPLGVGELWSAAWRWENAQPRVVLRGDFPVRIGAPGILRVTGVRERFRASSDTGVSGRLELRHRAAGVAFRSWLTPNLASTFGLRVEEWQKESSYLVWTAGMDQRGLGDRLRLQAELAYASALTSQRSYLRGEALVAWVSTVDLRKPRESARVGMSWISSHAPWGSWPQISGGGAMAIPMRAHRLVQGQQLNGEAIGRGIVHGGVAADRPVSRVGPVMLAVGLFLDGAQVRLPLAGPSPRSDWMVDAGGGIRLTIGDGSLGALRIDVAKGLGMGGPVAVTAGVHRHW